MCPTGQWRSGHLLSGHQQLHALRKQCLVVRARDVQNLNFITLVTTPADSLDACGYQKGGAGICNGTQFTQSFQPLPAILADTPSKFAKQTSDIIPTSTFKDTGYNNALSISANWLIFVSRPAGRSLLIVDWLLLCCPRLHCRCRPDQTPLHLPPRLGLHGSLCAYAVDVGLWWRSVLTFQRRRNLDSRDLQERLAQDCQGAVRCRSRHHRLCWSFAL